MLPGDIWWTGELFLSSSFTNGPLLAILTGLLGGDDLVTMSGFGGVIDEFSEIRVLPSGLFDAAVLQTGVVAWESWA
jgi:hypothetical protein